VLTQLEAAWKQPCLAHVARLFELPKKPSARALKKLWDDDGFGYALSASVGGLRIEARQRSLEILPELPGEPDAEAKRELAPWICGDGAAACDRTGSYIARAEAVFAAHDAEDRARAAIAVTAGTTAATSCADSAGSASVDPTPFESWATCTIGEVPRATVYADVRLRAPDRGWLVLRGRRGHYAFADEVRAYDLATGAAYVTRSESALVLGPHVDFGAVDARRVPDAYTGRVAADQLRELTFLLVTRTALVERRARATRVTVPPDIPFALSPHESSGFGASTSLRGFRGSSAQTLIAYTLVDGGRTLAEGHFTWPDASELIDDHADDLVRVMEAGLVKGCAPAKLPARLTVAAASTGHVSRIDAEPKRQAAVHGDLDRALDGLRTRACPGAL
jgi:hypothetical protein